MYMYTYIYINIYMHMYVHIYKYTHTETEMYGYVRKYTELYKEFKLSCFDSYMLQAYTAVISG